MPLPESFDGVLRLPAIAAPLFIVSTPEFVIAQCYAGVAGSFPALNARPVELLDEWLTQIDDALEAERRRRGPDVPGPAPYGVNLIVHRSNKRLDQDLAAVVRHKVPFVITSVGAPDGVVEAVHDYGGLVFHDVVNLRHAKRAIRSGVDGLILVTAGAGGHAGTINPFALLPEVRAEFEGTIVLAGAITSGAAVRAARVLGADLAYLGTRFIATAEANAKPEYKQMIVESAAADIVYTPAFTGVHGNYLRRSIEASGLDPENLQPLDEVSIGTRDSRPKRWKDIWGAGQGVGSIADVPTVAELVDRLIVEYAEAGAAIAADPFDAAALPAADSRRVSAR